MVRTDQSAVFANQELIGCPVQRTALMGAAVEIRANFLADLENRYITIAIRCIQAHFLAGFGPDVFQFAQFMQFDSPGMRPYLELILLK